MDEEDPDDFLEEDAFLVPGPLDPILDVDSMRSVMDAQLVQRIDCFRLDELARAAQSGLTNTELVERSVRLELAAAMRITEHAAGMLMARGQALVHRYPAALDSLGSGRMTPRHSEVLVSLLDAVLPDIRAGLIAPAVQLAETEPSGVFRRKLQSLIETAQAPTLAERHEAALTRRRAVFEPDLDGMAWLYIFGPAVELKAAHDRVTRIAKTILRAGAGSTTSTTQSAGLGAVDVAAPDAEPIDQPPQAPDGRTLDQIRADIYGDLLIDGIVPGHPKAARGIRAEAVVTVPALSLLDDAHAAAAEPARVEGLGPIPIAVARELCGGSKDWMRVLTHPETGMILSVGRRKYRPPKALRQLVKWRAARCLAPGCSMPAERCEVDHSVDWALGGETRLTNLNPFCTGHHIVKHGTEWSVVQCEGGVMQWTSPLGRVYIVEPERALPVFTVDEPAPF